MLRTHKGEFPLLYWLMPFMVGVVLGLYLPNTRWQVYIMAVAISSAAAFVGINLMYDRIRAYRMSWLGGLLMHVMLLSTGWLCCQWHNELNAPDHFSKVNSSYLIVKVTDEPRQKGIYTRFTAQVQSTVKHPASGKLLITVVADSNAHVVNYGDQLLIPAIYKPVDPPFNPAEFNYKQYLAHQNIYHQSFITRQQFRLLYQHTGNPVIAFSLALRQRLVASIKQYVHDPEAAAIASTLLLGYKADLSANVLQAYSKTGTIHVLSVSGAHVAIFFVLISFLLRPFKRYRYGRVLNAILSITLIWAYAVLTGLSPAVCRAALMLSMLVIGQAGSRPVHALNMLGFSAFALLLYNPYLITDVGFQLSYLAVFGLVVVQPIIYGHYEFSNKWLQKLWYLCSASLAAQLVTFPLSIWYFHQFPVYFLISNLLIILPAEAIVMIGLTFLLSTLIPALTPVTTWLAFILEKLILIMHAILTYIEHLPYASFGQLWLNWWEHLLLYAIIALLLGFMVYKKAYQLTATLTYILVLCCCLSWKAVNQQQRDRIIYFNLKKNTGILFQTGNKAVVVTDLASTHKNYRYSIQPCLDSLGVDSVQVISPEQDLRTAFLKKQGPLIQFKKKTVLLFDPLLHNVVLSKKITVDHLFFTHNPHADLTFIRNNYNFGIFIADANNSTTRILRLKHEADSLNQKINILSRNKSIYIISN